MNSTDPKIGKSPIRQALEDAIVVWAFAFTAALAVTLGNLHDWRDLVAPLLAALIAGTVAYARARGIQLPPTGGGNASG